MICWYQVSDGHAAARRLFHRHYSYQRTKKKNPALFVGPGEKMVLITQRCDALFVWRKFIDDSGETGVNCAAFRNESARLSSDLIEAAQVVAWQRWPSERLYTYVDANKIKSTNPGYCFLQAGWQRKETLTKSGKHILFRLPPVPFIAFDQTANAPAREAEI